MATTGPALHPSLTTFPGTSVYPGQGDRPTPWVLYSTSDANANATVWSSVLPKDLRGAMTERGRATELDTVNAGTAQIALSNRSRTYDPIAVAALRPMNRWWIREQFSGATKDIFKGYAESYELQYPSKGQDSVTVVSCVDEFKVLAQYRLPTTSPPRDTYQDVVMYDNPAGYWPMDSVNPGPAVVGEPMYAVGSLGAVFRTFANGIVGQTPSLGTAIANYSYMTTAPLQPGQSGDAGGLAEFSVEFMFKCYGALPSVATTPEYLVTGPSTVGPLSTWSFILVYTGQVILSARNSGGTHYQITSTTVIQAGSSAPWYHIVGTITGGYLRLYINGVEDVSTAWTGTFATITAGSAESDTYGLVVGNGGALAWDFRHFDELAFFRYGLTAARITDHYTAARLRGFPYGQLAGERISAILDYVGSTAPRAIRAGTRAMTGAYMNGQEALAEIRNNIVPAELSDGVLFIAADGTITFLDGGHRSASPWNTVQATFDDDGTDLQYDDLKLDYSDSFLENEVKVTIISGLTSTASDATSISRYGKKSKSIDSLQVTSSSSAAAIAAALLAKYKDPLVRVTSLAVNTGHPAVTEAVFNLDIGSRIRVFRRPVGGGAAIDQTLFVQSIAVELRRNGIWTINLGVSPL